MIYDFADIMGALSADEHGHYHVSPSPEWRQGRTLYGGLTAAIAVRSAEAAQASSHPLRSAQFAFTGAAGDAIETEIKTLASGRSTDFIQVVCSSQGRTILNALLCFGAHRSAAAPYADIALPQVAPPGECAAFFTHPQVPAYTRQLDARLAQGAPVGAQAARPDLTLWLRHRAARPEDVASSVVALADALPPAILLTTEGFVPVSSLTWHLDVLTESFSAASWFLARSVADTAAAGYSSQDMTMWAEDGTPVIRARQTIAVYS